MKCAIVYLSMTGNTETIAMGVRDGILSVTGNCDMIKFRDASPYEFGKYDLIAFGTIVMGYKDPDVFGSFIKSLRYVGGKHAIAFATHGTHGEYFPAHIAQELVERQMKVLGVRRWYANSYIPGHANPYPTAGHPDKIDVEEAKAWGAEMARLSEQVYAGAEDLIPPLPEAPEVSLKDFLDELNRKEDERSGGTFGSKTPHIQLPNQYIKETCRYPKCSICMDNCPVHGIDLTMDPPVFGDPCCHCMLCAKLCPTGSISPDFFYTTPGEKTMKLVPEFYLERLAIDEKEGLFRRKVPVEEIGWDTPYYKTYNKHPWFIKGKGPNGPNSKYWGEVLAEADAAAEAEASGSDPS